VTKPKGTYLCVSCPCRERFELALHDGGAMWGEEFEYVRPLGARSWLPRLRALFRILFLPARKLGA
jgi:hypothetical protein